MNASFVNPPNEYTPYIYTFCEAFFAFWIVYLVVENVLNSLGKTYDGYHSLTPEKKADFISRIVANIHGVVAVIAAIASFYCE
jgi:hypothetical protein